MGLKPCNHSGAKQLKGNRNVRSGDCKQRTFIWPHLTFSLYSLKILMNKPNNQKHVCSSYYNSLCEYKVFEVGHDHLSRLITKPALL